MMRVIFFLFSMLIFSTTSFALVARRDLITFQGEGIPPHLRVDVGKKIVHRLIEANGKTASTTSCRLENKCVVTLTDLEHSLTSLKNNKIDLTEREVKNLPKGARAGTFTFYGTSIRFAEGTLITNIKMRIRMYMEESDAGVRRAPITEKMAFLELKIKNPLPDYPLSVHKYRLELPDEDILFLVHLDPLDQRGLYAGIETLKHRAFERDKEKTQHKLIEAMFDSIRLLSIAEPNFIKPSVAIAYHRISKRYDEPIPALKRKAKKKGKDKRSYEITIDSNLRAFKSDLLNDETSIDISRYFLKERDFLLATYPADARVVEFKQPDAIGYQGPGKIRTEEAMDGPQKLLYQALVRDLARRKFPHSTLNRGKFFHIKQFLRILEGKSKEGETSLLLGKALLDF